MMKKKLQFVLENGKPTAVILDLQKYRQLLERAEDLDDLRVLKAMRARPLKFRKLDDFLRERAAGV